MAQNFPTLEFDIFNGGLNLRDDENDLPINQSPNMQNFEISATGMSKTPGWEAIDNSYPSFFHMEGLIPYRLVDGSFRFVSVSYPDIVIIDPATGNFEYAQLGDISSPGVPQGRYRGWTNNGRPFGVQVGDFLALTDGANRPILLDQNLVYEPNWPFNFVADNNDADNLGSSYYATASNPGTDEIGNPYTSILFKNRWWVTDSRNRRRLFVTKANAFKSGEVAGFDTIFSDNTAANVNISFFADIPISSDITGLGVIGDEELIIFCENGLVRLTGNNPPSEGYPAPSFDFDVITESVGAISPFLIAPKGDNDIFFFSNKKTLYRLSKIEESLQVKPKGISDRIFPAFKDLDLDTFRRGLLSNHRIKGELYFFFPKKNNKTTPDNAYILNYDDGEDPDETWTKVDDFEPFEFTGASEIDSDGEFYVLSPSQIYKANTGIAFAGNVNKSVYQIPTQDFGLPKHKKRIIDITLYATSTTGADLTVFHLWESGESGSVQVSIPANTKAQYDVTDYGGGNYTSKAGQPFRSEPFKIVNRVGKLLKMTLQHTSSTQDLTIHKIVIRYKILGQRN